MVQKPSGQLFVDGDPPERDLPLPLGHDREGGSQSGMVGTEDQDSIGNLDCGVYGSGHGTGIEVAGVRHHHAPSLETRPGRPQMLQQVPAKPVGLGGIETAGNGSFSQHGSSGTVVHSAPE